MTLAFDPDDLQRRADGVRALARKLVGDEHRAEDVIQQALAASYATPSDAVRSRGGWFRSVVRNLSLRSRRDEATRQRYEHGAPSPAPPGDPAETVARAELHRLVVDAVLALDEPYRNTLLRRFFDGLTAVEIAAEQDIPAATVRTRVRRGLEQLRERLDDTHGDRRAWAVLLLPLLRDPRPVTPPPPPVPLIPVSTGVAVMSAKKLAAVVVALLVVVGVWWGASSREGNDKSRDAAPPVVAETPEARERATAPPEVEEPELPDPVDFAAVDRDLDLHGRVVDMSGAPVAGARIETFKTPWHRRVLNPAQRNTEYPVSETVSARDGSFRVRLTRGERVALRATAAGFAPTDLPICVAGQRITLTLTPGVTLRVLAIGPDGEPLPNTDVKLDRSVDSHAGQPRVSALGKTGPDGVCRLTGLPPHGAGTLSISHELGTAWSANVQLPVEGETEVQLRLPAGRVLSGVVTDAETGEIVAGARVSDSWTFPRVVVTDEKGRFALPNATGETFGLWAMAPGYSEGAARIEGESETTIELSAAVELVGRLFGPDGAPVAAANIAVISDPSGGSLARINVHGASDADGRFRIEGLCHRDPHVVIVMADGLVRYLIDTDASGTPGSTIDLGDVKLPQGRRVSGTVTTRRGTPIANVVVTLKGTNADRSRLRSEGGAVAAFYGSDETCWTDDLGRFHFTDVAAGEYSLTAVARGRKNASTSVQVDDADIDDLALEFVGGKRLKVSVVNDAGEPVSMVSITGTTSDGWSLSAPTPADGVIEFDSDTRVVSLQAFSWNNGDVRYATQAGISVPEGQTEIEIVLERLGLAKGRIVDPSGTAVPNAMFHVIVDGEVLRQESPFDNMGFARTNGEFTALVPEDGDAVIELVRSSFVDAETGVTMTAVGRLEGVNAGDTDLVLRARPLPRDRSVDVRVVSPEGEPVSGATVRARLSQSSDWLTPEATGRNGRVYLEDLQPTEYVFNAELPDGHPGLTAWVPPVETVTPSGQEVVLAYREGTPIAGLAVDDEGAPIAGATVAVYAGRRPLATHVTDADGRFAFAIAPEAERPLYLFVYLNADGRYREHRDADFEPGAALRVVLQAP